MTDLPASPLPADAPADAALVVRGLAKTFTLHNQGGVSLPVLRGIDLDVRPGECLVLTGPSGAGKSSLLRCLYGNYLADAGRILVRHQGSMVDIARAEPHVVLVLRRGTLGHVSQFLRAIPRVPTIRLVMEPLVALGMPVEAARERAAALLDRLRVPPRLQDLPPATFSGGEQQRVNIARTLAVDYPILLLDEPTASLDQANRDTVLELIEEARGRGAAIVGIFHDAAARERLASRTFDVAGERAAA